MKNDKQTLPTKLNELKLNQDFMLPDWKAAGRLTYLGPDGSYGKIRAHDKKIHEEMCARYDSTGAFFEIAMWTPVTPICPECKHVQDHEACNGRIE
jgi:hypothetical protein